jgi:methylglyoxal synthase
MRVVSPSHDMTMNSYIASKNSTRKFARDVTTILDDLLEDSRNIRPDWANEWERCKSQGFSTIRNLEDLVFAVWPSNHRFRKQPSFAGPYTLLNDFIKNVFPVLKDYMELIEQSDPNQVRYRILQQIKRGGSYGSSPSILSNNKRRRPNSKSSVSKTPRRVTPRNNSRKVTPRMVHESKARVRKDNFSSQFDQFHGENSHVVPRAPRRMSFKNQLMRSSIGSDSASRDSSHTLTSADNIIDLRITMNRRRSSMATSSLLGLDDDLIEELANLIPDEESDDGDLEPEKKGDVVVDQTHVNLDPDFKSHFRPEDMRCLALVAHNHMKPSIKQFVLANKNLLKKFRLTGTNTTMTMLREVFGDDPDVAYGPTCTSGPLGGDAELVAVMCVENLGGCVFFQDPMSAHPHSADIECLNRQANVHNVLMMPNPTTAHACMTSLRYALMKGRAERIPSFFRTLESPSVSEYKHRQAEVIKNNIQ